MKKLLLLTFLAFACLCFTPAVSTASVAVNDMTTMVEKVNAQQLRIEAEKSEMKEKKSARLFKKILNKSQAFADGVLGARGHSGFSVLAFLMGFIFSWIGLLLVWIFGGNTRSALIGVLVGLLLWVLIIFG